MPPPNLGDTESDDVDDDDGSSDGSSSSDASTHSSDSNQESGTDDEDEVDPIPMGLLLDGTIAFEIPFRDKLQSFGLSKPEANFIVQNGATSPIVFTRLFRYQVVQRVKMFHHCLNDQHATGRSLTGIALEGFTDQVMATLVDVDSHGSAKREHDSMSSKGSGLMFPMLNVNQSQYKVWSQKW
jgi:hypothetical protein